MKGVSFKYRGYDIGGRGEDGLCPDKRIVLGIIYLQTSPGLQLYINVPSFSLPKILIFIIILEYNAVKLICLKKKISKTAAPNLI